MGRMNIEIDDFLIDKAMRLTGARTKREVVDIALRRLIQKGTAYRALRRLRGKLAWDGDIDQWRIGCTTSRDDRRLECMGGFLQRNVESSCGAPVTP